MEKVLLMYSAGKASFLSAMVLIEQGYKVLLVTFDNGYLFEPYFSSKQHMEIDRLQGKYGTDKVEWIGVIPSTIHMWENKRAIFDAKDFKKLSSLDSLTPGQIECLSCKSAMYFEALRYCLANDIHYIAEGARHSKDSVIQKARIIGLFRTLLKRYGIELLLPAFNIENSWQIDNQLIARGFIPKTIEWRCIAEGLSSKLELDQQTRDKQETDLEGVFNTHILPIIDKELSDTNLHPQLPPQKKIGKYDYNGY